MKGIILAGGAGTRLHPATISISKQLIPVYDKPMIYYPLSVLMLGGIRDILIITTQAEQPRFQELLGDGTQWGLSFTYKIQPEPNGLAEAFIIGEKFIGDDNVTLILGDNIFWGTGFIPQFKRAIANKKGATVFGYFVNDPERYGVVEFDDDKNILSLEEKPNNPKSNFAVTGLYCYDNHVIEYVKKLSPSARGELEITDLNNIYLFLNELHVEILNRGCAWLDTGTHNALLQASQLVETIQNRQGLLISSPEEIAFKNKFINEYQLEKLAQKMSKNDYGQYLLRLVNETG